MNDISWGWNWARNYAPVRLMDSNSYDRLQGQNQQANQHHKPSGHEKYSQASRQPSKYEVLTQNHRVAAMMLNSFVTAVTYWPLLGSPFLIQTTATRAPSGTQEIQNTAEADGIALRSKQINLVYLCCEKSKIFPGGIATALWLH